MTEEQLQDRPVTDQHATMNLPVQRKVFIVGSQSLQNQLLADFINQASDELSCDTLAGINDLNISELVNCTTLLLIDNNTADVGPCLDTINDMAKQDLVAHAALFNVPDEQAISQYAGKLHMNGAFFQSCAQEQFIKGVQGIFEGELWLPRRIMSDFMAKNRGLPAQFDGAGSNLTDREVEVLRVMATGASNSDIALQLGLSPHTVKTHIYNIFKKINASNRLQAVNWAHRNLG